MRRWWFTLLAIPSAANAQPTTQPQQDAPLTLDPGAPAGPPKTAPPPSKPRAQQPAPTENKPNVVIVGPDGKVMYDPNANKPAAAGTAGGYYYTPGGDDPMGGFGYEPSSDEPVSLHTGPTPELHVVRKGDTLWDICFYYFNDPWQWPKVWSFNPQITNPHWIYPGDLVRLLPRGVFAQNQEAVTEPEGKGSGGSGQEKPVDKLPAPAQRTNVGLKQTAFVEKSDLDKANKVAGSVDEKELLAVGDSIYVSYPPNNPPKVGQRYSVYKPDNKVKSGGKEQGAYVRILGTVEVESVKQDKKARARIVEANQEIERGANIGPLQKQYNNVPPVPAKVDAQGTIVAMLTKDQLIGQGEIVFVDLGKGSGVQVGNRLFVVRRGDALPPKSKDTVGQDDRRYPARSLGEIRIVEVGDKISVALVTLSVKEMSVGDIVMMQKAQ